MLKVGITGQIGFIGSHLYNLLGIETDIERIPFHDEFFSGETTLRHFVRQCDVIVHLAAMNRHSDPHIIYNTNIRLVKQLIAAMEAEQVAPHVIFSSSIQEERDNLYGASKREGRVLLAAWAERNGGKFTGCIIPNVFGPFGKPNYNSVVATFCHKLTHGEEPEIQVDNTIKLVYVDDLCREMIQIMRSGEAAILRPIPYRAERKVSELLATFRHFRDLYFKQGILPELRNRFDLQLFNTFCCYPDYETFYPFILKSNSDKRGTFVELIKMESLGGQISFSTTRPGITRGNHYHTRKIERFAVIRGKARIELRRIGTTHKMVFELDGAYPAFVDIPVWHTHSLTNIGEEDLYTIFWINEFYNPNDPDTFYEEV